MFSSHSVSPRFHQGYNVHSIIVVEDERKKEGENEHRREKKTKQVLHRAMTIPVKNLI